MNIIHSFWSKPYFSKNTGVDDRDLGGWHQKKYFYMSWVLSCLQFKKFYPKVNLITDKRGKEIFIDKLELPYAKVEVVLDELNNYNHKLWAIAKIYAYSIQKEPFIHVDGDVFIWKKFPVNLETAGLVVQDIDNNERMYSSFLKMLVDNYSYIPEVIKKYNQKKDMRSVNAGILGGNNLDFIKQYCKDAFEFIEQNETSLNKVDDGFFNLLFEQYLFKCLAHQSKLKIHPYLKNLSGDNRELANFAGVPNKTKYIHTLGQIKRNSMTGNNLEKVLIGSYPEYYFKIIRLINQNEL